MIDEAKLNDFMGKVLGDLGGASTVAMVRIGDELGLYKALHAGGPMTCAELATRLGLAERYLREWLSQQAASGYLTYDPMVATFALPAEQAMVFAIEDSPVYMMGGFDVMKAMLDNQPKVQAAFRSGGGVAWGDQAGCMFCAVARFFRPGYHNSLVSSMAAGARRRGGQARTRRQGRRYRLRPRLVDGADGARPSRTRSSSATTSTRLDRRRHGPMPQAHGVGGNARFEVGGRQGGSRHGVRSGDLLRLPARHGRPGRSARRMSASR